MEGIILYTIGCLTGILIGLMLLIMQMQMMKHETHEKPTVSVTADAPAISEEEERMQKQFDNFLSYTGKKQDDNSI